MYSTLSHESRSQHGITFASTFAEDGPVCMSQDSLMKYYSRSLLQLNLYFLRQLPGWKININSAAFLSSISYEREASTARVQCPEWAMAPAGTNLVEDDGEGRQSYPMLCLAGF